MYHTMSQSAGTSFLKVCRWCLPKIINISLCLSKIQMAKVGAFLLRQHVHVNIPIFPILPHMICRHLIKFIAHHVNIGDLAVCNITPKLVFWLCYFSQSKQTAFSQLAIFLSRLKFISFFLMIIWLLDWLWIPCHEAHFHFITDLGQNCFDRQYLSWMNLPKIMHFWTWFFP